MKNFALLGFLLFPATFAQAQVDKKQPFDAVAVKAMFDKLLPGMGAKDIGARFGPQQQWQEICYKAGAPGNEAMRLEVCKLMIARLDKDTPAPARIWLLKQLEFLGGAESVDGVAAALNDTNVLVRDAAVRCLANNPAKEATAKLVAELQSNKNDVKTRTGLVNALGFRADRAAVPALALELKNTDAAVATAAARALGKIATPPAAQTLQAAYKDAPAGTRLSIADAWLVCADRRLKEGKTTEAAAIYMQLYDNEKPNPIRWAALQGVLKTSGNEAGNLILDIIGGKDENAKQIAIGQIENINLKALKPLADNMDKLPTSGQVLLLGALRARGDRSQMGTALAAVKSPQLAVQQAGIQALGKLGDASVVPLLLGPALLAKSKLSDAARESLVSITADGVNDKIIAALKAAKEPGKRGTLIAILEARRATAAVPVLLDDAGAADAGTRKAAMSALRQLAEPEHVPAMTLALLKTDKGAERDEAERTIATVCEKIGDAKLQAVPVLKIYAKEGAAEKALLLPLLGRIGGHGESLKIIQEALHGKDEKIRAAGVQALCNWPDPSVSDELFELVKSAKSRAERDMPLRSLVRVNSVPSSASNAEKLGRLKELMALPIDDHEKLPVFDGLATVKDMATLRYVLPYLNDKKLAQAACKTIVELAHSRTLREPNQAEFVTALNRVIAICKDKGLIDRAKKYKEGN